MRRGCRSISSNLLLAIVAAAISGCATVRSATSCTLEDDAPWRLVTTPHFRIFSHASSEATLQSAIRLEQRRLAMLAHLGLTTSSATQLEVVLFEDSAEYEDHGSPESGGVLADWGFHRVALLPANTAVSEYSDSTLSHELAHYIAAFAFPRLPIWLTEGLAESLETIEIEGDLARIGRAPRDIREDGLDTRYLWSIDQLWAAEVRPTGRALHLFYQSTWAWVTFLRNKYPTEWKDFTARLARPEEPKRAWAAVFGRHSSTEMDREMRSYFDGGQNMVTSYKLPKLDFGISAAVTLSHADVHVLRARLFRLNLPKRDQDRAEQLVSMELYEAMQHEPAHAEARILEVSLMPANWAGDARRRLGSLWRRSAEAAVAFDESQASNGAPNGRREAFLKKALEAHPKDAQLQNRFAALLIEASRLDDALHHASTAELLSPWHPDFAFRHAAILALLRRCPEAVTKQERALELLSESESAHLIGHYRQALERYRGACAMHSPEKTATRPAQP